MALMFATAMEEWRESPKTVDVTFNRGLVGRISQVMDLTRDREVEQLEQNLSWLGTIASTAPFVGLLGTVWGIIKAFQKMAIEGGGGLGTVSGAIAEALINTAFGLLVAIPAVMFFNNLTNRVEEMQVDITDSTTELVDFFMKEGR
jgi:biopolymer transport protein ExbB/TolQ